MFTKLPTQYKYYVNIKQMSSHGGKSVLFKYQCNVSHRAKVTIM